MAKIVVIGSANIDLVATMDRLPSPGETVGGRDFVMNFGGKGANQAIAAARLGGAVTMVASVGEDAYGRDYEERFRDERILTEHVKQTNAATTGTALIYVDRDGRNMIVVVPGANHSLTSKDIERAEAAIAGADLVVLQLEIPAETVKAAIAMANRVGTPVALNFSPIDPAIRLADLGRIDYLIVNEYEAALLSGVAADDETGAMEASRRLIAMGVGHVVVTRGAEPTVVNDAGRIETVKTVKVEPVDTVGAGDTFAGALAVMIAEGHSLGEAAAFANRAGAMSTRKLGAQASMPLLEEVQASFDK